MNPIKFIPILFTLMLSACADRHSSGGSTVVGSGGEGHASEFIACGRETAQFLRTIDRIYNLDQEIFEAVKAGFGPAVERVSVEFVTDKLSVLDSGAEREVTFLKFVEINRIQINLDRWLTYIDRDEPLRRVVIHEYLAFVDPSFEELDAKYAITDKIVAAIHTARNHRIDEGAENENPTNIRLK